MAVEVFQTKQSENLSGEVIMSEEIIPRNEAPVWLTANFLRELLQIPNNIQIKSVQYACKKGENFASKIYRVKYESESGVETTVIVKSRPFENNGFNEEFLKKFNVFGKEIETYNLMGKFEEILNKAIKQDIDHDECFAPKCLKVASLPTDILIIEDFCAKGYEVAPKEYGLDLERMRVVIRKLANFHASSAIYYERNGPFDEKYSRGVYNSDMKSIFEESYFNFTFIVENFLSTWPQLDKKIIDKMRNWRKFIMDELIRAMQPSSLEKFNCLNHGDFWISNILFLNDENGNVKDCAFIDFQQCVYTSPAIDLLSLIVTSASITTKIQYFDYYIKFYHENLVETLNRLNYTKKIPTLKEFYMDIIDRGFLAVWNGFSMLPACLVMDNVDELSSTDNLLSCDEEGLNYKKKLYDNERYRKHMTELLTFFDNRGLVQLC